jgi:hypothetical protein
MHHGASSLSRLFCIAVAFLLLAGARPAPASDLSLGPEWREAVKTLRGLPVQDTGFIRSGQSFAENVLSAITGKKESWADGGP